METENQPRVIAIVGRPNVGKSALFNRIAHKRIAIVHDQHGVTRDRIMRDVAWEDHPFRLIDTGGIRLFDGVKESDSIEMAVRNQVDVALEDASIVILVVDVMAGLHPADEEVARMVRKSGKQCIVAVNKCDLPQHNKRMPEFEKLSFDLFPISAQHNIGMTELMDRAIAALPPVPPYDPTVQKPLRVAIVGRPNAGKSSYINRLLKSERVIVSDVSGTTRDCVDVPFTIGTGEAARHYVLVDTAGMRNRHKIDNSVERFSLFRSEEAIKECDVAVLVMDATIGPTSQDKYIASLIQRENKGCVLIMNKWDVSRQEGLTETSYEPEFRADLPFLNHCPLCFMSAKEGYNVRNTIDVIDQVSSNTQIILPTGLLNRTISNAIEKTQVPSKNGRQLRFHYATQTGAKPMIVRLFVNDGRIVTSPFQTYLIKSIRSAFNLVGAPLVLQFRSRVQSADKKADATETPDPDAAPINRRPRPQGRTRKPAAGGKGKGGAKRKTTPHQKVNNLTPKSRRPRR